MDVYEQVSEHPLYEELNRRLVRSAPPAIGACVLDIGCGTGSISELVLAETPSATVVAADPDRVMCDAVKRRLGERVVVLQAGAEESGRALTEASADIAFAANCVHLFPDVGASFRAIAGALRPGGAFLFNTAFHEAAARRDERAAYWEVVLRARRLAQRAGASRRPSKPGPTERPLAKRPLNADLYSELLCSAGLTDIEIDEVEVVLDRDLVLDIVASPMFASGALPGIDPATAVEAMTEAVTTMFASAELTVHRRWLFVSSTRTG